MAKWLVFSGLILEVLNVKEGERMIQILSQIMKWIVTTHRSLRLRVPRVSPANGSSKRTKWGQKELCMTFPCWWSVALNFMQKKKLISVHKSLLFGRIRTQISHSRIRQPRCWKVFLEWTSHRKDHPWPFSPCLCFSICRPDHSAPSGVRSPQTLCLSFSLPWAVWISPSFFCCWRYLSLCFLSHPLFQAPNRSSMSWGQRPSPEQPVGTHGQPHRIGLWSGLHNLQTTNQFYEKALV